MDRLLSTTTKVVRNVVTLLIFVLQSFLGRYFYSPRVIFLAYYIYGSSFSTHRTEGDSTSNVESPSDMVLIRLKEPLTKDADARESVANGGGGPVRSIIHQVMKMISLSNIGRVITPCNTDVECTSS